MFSLYSPQHVDKSDVAGLKMFFIFDGIITHLYQHVNTASCNANVRAKREPCHDLFKYVILFDCSHILPFDNHILRETSHNPMTKKKNVMTK